MTLLIAKPQKTSHWYDKSGQPQHTIPDAKGSPRATTVRDARKFGWLPSVTSILDIIAKPGLNAWIIDQAILAALTLPRLKNESDDAFAQRVGQDMDAQRDKSASLGSEIHAAIANHLQGGVTTGEMVRYVDAFAAWANNMRLEAIYSEQAVVSLEHGYAGCLDLYARTQELGRVLVDIKTQKVKGKANFYETWPLQLVAYCEALRERGEHVDHCISLVIDTETAKTETKIWDEDDLSFAAFQGAFRVWQYVKNYDPNYYKKQ